MSPFNLLWLVILAAAWGLSQLPASGGGPLVALPKISGNPVEAVSFAMCGAFRRTNCVIDGDTFRYDGRTIRIADIDAPETHPPRCAREADLGEQATRRLRALLNDGPFALRAGSDRDLDQYGRELKVVVRDGRSIGTILVGEGLARRWTGSRQPWCG